MICMNVHNMDHCTQDRQNRPSEYSDWLRFLPTLITQLPIHSTTMADTYIICL